MGRSSFARWALCIVAVGALVVAAVLLLRRPREASRPAAVGERPEAPSAPSHESPPAPSPLGGATADAVFREDFSSLALPGPKWVPTRDGDFKEAAVDALGGRLRLRAGTIGTRDDTVKHLGIRSAEPIVDLTRPIEVAFEVDWNNQANGCYLQASVFLCPTKTDATAAAEPDWLKFEYVGVPPGRNARGLLATRRAGNLRFLYTEGWPDQQRVGRTIGKQRVVLRFGPQTVEVIENGKSLCGPLPHALSFQRAWLYLELCSHSNYPARELFFDGIAVRPVPVEH